MLRSALILNLFNLLLDAHQKPFPLFVIAMHFFYERDHRLKHRPQSLERKNGSSDDSSSQVVSNYYEYYETHVYLLISVLVPIMED